MTAKNLKFRPGIFLSVDDLSGGRKVVMVCKDGVTYWDSMQGEIVTPVALHDVIKPEEIGTFVEYVNTKNAVSLVQALIAHFRLKMDVRVDNDPLFLMRVLWHVMGEVEAEKIVITNWSQESARFNDATLKAEAEEARALRLHMHAETFHATETA